MELIIEKDEVAKMVGHYLNTYTFKNRVEIVSLHGRDSTNYEPLIKTYRIVLRDESEAVRVPEAPVVERRIVRRPPHPPLPAIGPPARVAVTPAVLSDPEAEDTDVPF